MTNSIGQISSQKMLNVTVLVLLAICVISIPTIYAEDHPPAEITEKDDRKMDSRLAALYDDVSTGNAPNALSYPLTLSQDDQRVQVILIMSDAESQVPQDLGIVVETTYENMVQANIPITNLEAASMDPSVLFIQVPIRPVPVNESNPLNHQSGHVLREGAQRMMADRLHAAGYTGNGIKVAVIDSGFDTSNPEISGNIAEARSFRTDGNIRGEQGNEHQHGTASAETVVDVAPDVQLYLYNTDTNLGFNAMVDHIIDKDVDIITRSLGTFGVGPANGTSYVSMKANQTRDNGILWFNSAGNYAQSHWEGRFNDPDNDGWHNFQGEDETINISIPPYLVNKPLTLYLSWWDSPSQDFDLHLDKGDVEVAVGDNPQPRTIPFEDIRYIPQDTTTLHVSISKYAATENAYFQLFSKFNFDEYRVPNHSVTIPADATGVVAVGAYGWQRDTLEPYSSQGPTIDGRTKPDLSASTCATTSAYYPDPYCGTSGASPHAAGAAALIMQKYPDATADQVQKLMESTVKSRHAKSNQDGTGRVDLDMFVNSDILALDNSNSACASDNSCFFPKTLRVSRGDTVTWTNADNSPITITGNSGNSNFNSGQIFRGDSYPQTFTTDGTFSYSDGLHSWATGQIIVGSGVASSPPTFSSATYNQSSGVLTITFSKTIDKQRLNLSGLDIRESGYSSGGADLADARMQSTVNSATLTLTLTNADRTAVNSMTSPQLDISSGAIRDLDGNMIIAASDRPITITGSADTTPPTFVSATYNRNTGILTTTFSELISKNNLNLSNLDIREAGQFSGGVDLADAMMQTSANTSTLTLTLTASDRNAVNAMRTPQLDITAGAVRDVAGNSIFTTSDRPITVTGSSGNDGDLRSMIAELRSMINTINSKLASLESSVNSLTARVAALESGGGTPPPPEPMTGVKGKIYTDTNNNNRLDPGERGRAGIEVITVSLANHSDVQRLRTDANGDFTFERNAGGYLLQAIGGGPNSYAYITIPNNTMLVQNLAY